MLDSWSSCSDTLGQNLALLLSFSIPQESQYSVGPKGYIVHACLHHGRKVHDTDLGKYALLGLGLKLGTFILACASWPIRRI